MINTTHFFRQANADQFTGSMAYLDSQQSLFQRDQTSGMIEIQIGQSEWFMLLFARGASSGTFHLTNGFCQPVSMAELHAHRNSLNAPIFSLAFPDVAGRLVWLALESQAQTKCQVRNAAEWAEWLKERKAEKLTGLVQHASELFDGFIYLKEGEMVMSESTFSTDQGFQANLPFYRYQQENPCELTLYKSTPASPARQTFILRLGMYDWTHLILNRYKEMVGQKLVQIMIDQTNLSIEPWQWTIQLENTSLWDQHFFPSLDAAATAYRALLMSMGEQSSMMIGNSLTQRLMSETYNRLRPEENELLEAQRLVPAAFI